MRRHVILSFFLRLVTKRRGVVYGLWGLLCALSVVSLAINGLHIDTGRQNLVSEQDPDARRFRRFAELFGTTLNAVVVVQGEDPEANRQFVDALAAELRTETRVGSIFCRVSADDFRRYALLYAEPEQLRELLSALRQLKDLAKGRSTFEVDGIVGALGHTNALFARLEDGDTEGLGALAELKVDASETSAALGRAFELLREMLTGPPFNELQLLARAGVTEVAAAGIDGQGYLTAKEGKLAFLFAQPSSSDEQASTLTAFVDAIEGAGNRVLPPGVSFGVTGYPAHIATETRLVVHDVWFTSIAAVIGVVILFALMYGSALQTLFMLVPLGAGVLVTMGLVSATVGRINVLSSAFFAFLVGLGVDFGIHIIARFNESRVRGASPEQSAEDSLILTGPGVVTGGFTTIAAFLALLASDFSGQVELGVLAAGGLFWVLLAALTLGPSLLVGHALRVDSDGRDPRAIRVPAGLARVLRGAVVRPGLPLGGAVVLTALLAPAVRPLQFDFDVSRLLPPDAPAVTAYEALREHEVFSPDFAVLLMPSAALARDATRRLLERPDLVARVESAATYLPPDQEAKVGILAEIQAAHRELPSLQWRVPASSDVDKLIAELEALAGFLEVDLPLTLKMYGRDALVPVAARAAEQTRTTIAAIKSAPASIVKARLAELDAKLAGAVSDTLAYLARTDLVMGPEDLPPAIQSGYWRRTAEGEHFAVRVYPKGDIADPAFMEQFRAFVSQVDPDVTGLPITFLAWGVLFREGMERAAVLALLIVTFLVWFDFRRIVDTALALFPLALGATWMVGAMNVVGIDYNFANVIALPLILGIGIDSGVHVLHRYREGTPPRELPVTTGKAIGASSLTTILAFGTLAAAEHRGLETLGITLVIGVAGCLVAAAVVLPSLLYWLDSRRARNAT